MVKFHSTEKNLVCAYCGAGKPDRSALIQHQNKRAECRRALKAAIQQRLTARDPLLVVPSDDNGTSTKLGIPDHDNVDSIVEDFADSVLDFDDSGTIFDESEPIDRRARVDDCDDEDDNMLPNTPASTQKPVFVFESYPFPEGESPIAEPGTTSFEDRRNSGDSPWGEFKSQSAWEMAEWLMSRGLSNDDRNRFFALNEVCNGVYHGPYLLTVVLRMGLGHSGRIIGTSSRRLMVCHMAQIGISERSRSKVMLAQRSWRCGIATQWSVSVSCSATPSSRSTFGILRNGFGRMQRGGCASTMRCGLGTIGGRLR